ncbi:hypothetical protein HPB50_002421 [Hyalomma asiaticum]|uniref:Uncharacterized protein n=1 Tax=Hyalomma asiaticum TaxID=266040 RepID=A0ACB7SFQ8_HYAAI|nr:hypothetical protein HPB50_002421 [Hyalomma asiaticum]
MAYLELNVEQVNKAAELLAFDAQDIDPLASVVDPRLDIHSSKSAAAGSSTHFLAESEQSRRSSVASSAGSTVGKAQAPPGPPAGTVAEYVTTENPTLCTQVAECIEKHSLVHSPRRAQAAPASSVAPRSPLKCMAQAADALAVQQSTIGVPLKPPVPTKAVYQELVEYPPESIVASVDERASWLRTILEHPSCHREPRTPNPLVRNQCTITRRELPSVHNWRRPSEDPGFDADNFDSASMCSETESNLSWVSDVDDEIRMLNFAAITAREKMATATQTDPLSSTGSVVAHVGVETDETDLLAILKEKAHLEGELDTLQGELGRLVQAKSELKTRAAAAEARCQKLAEEKDAAVQREASLQQELQSLKMESVRYGRVVGDYDSLIHSKESETGFLHDEAAKKIAEMHVESQSAVRARAQLEAENASIRNQLQVVEKSKDWFRDQLHESQQGRNQLHKEHVSIQAEKIALESTAEMLRAENARLAQELLEARHRSVRDKESLMKRLEDIEADLLEREATLTREAAAAQSQQPASDAGDLSGKFRVAELEEQLRSAESSLSERSAALSALERERTELVTEVQRLRLRLSDSELGRRNQDELLREGVQKVRRLQTELVASEERVTELRNQKAALEVGLAAANEDKRIVGESLGTLTENLARLEGNFKLIRTEQVAKTAQIDQLQREKASLAERLSEAEGALSLARKELASRSNAQSQAQAMEVSQLRKQCSDLQNVVRVLEVDLKKSAAEAREVAARHDADKEKLRQSEERLEHAEAELETLAQRNAVLENQLRESAQRLVREEARRAASLQEQAQLHDLSTWETRVRELEQTLATREMATREQERMHKSNIRLLTRKLREKMKELKLAQVQLANAESQQQDEELRRQGQKSVSRQVQTLDGPEKVSSEAQTDATAKTQEEQTELAEKNQELLLKLEREQGRLAGSLKAQEELRACVEQLERQLSEQGGRMAELQCQMEQVQGRADQAQALHQSSVADLQRELEKERTLSKELRQRIFEEKRRGGQLQRQLSSLKQGLSEASQSADAGRLKAQAQVERAQSLEAQLREAQGRLEALRADLAASQAARQELEAKLRNAQERDPALEQQMKLLSWNVKEKTQEVAALQERLRAAETAHQAEVVGLRRQLEEAQQQHSDLSAELMSVRKEKFTLQARLQELRNVLRSRMEQCKELQRQLTELAETTEFDLPNVVPDYDDSYITELLQQCSSQPTTR